MTTHFNTHAVRFVQNDPRYHTAPYDDPNVAAEVVVHAVEPLNRFQPDHEQVTRAQDYLMRRIEDYFYEPLRDDIDQLSSLAQAGPYGELAYEISRRLQDRLRPLTQGQQQ